MRRKTEIIDHLQDGDKYELRGWNNDVDDFTDSNNLLKILEKKITFPILENDHKFKKKISKKLQTLPSVVEAPKKIVDTQPTKHHQNTHLSPIIKVQRRQKLQSLGDEKNAKANLKKSRTENKKLCVMQKQKNVQQVQEKSPARQQKNRSMKNLLNFAESIKNNQANNHSAKKVGKLPETSKLKHQKMGSVENFPVQLKLAIFKDDNVDNHTQKAETKMIKWERFNISKQKTSINFYQNKDLGIPSVQAYQEKLLKRKQISYHEIQSNSQWLEKMLSKNKLQKALHSRREKMNTEARDYFLDDHLQSPFNETKTAKFNY